MTFHPPPVAFVAIRGFHFRVNSEANVTNEAWKFGLKMNAVTQLSGQKKCIPEELKLEDRK